MKKKQKNSAKGSIMSGDDALISKLHRKLKRFGSHRMKKIYSQNINARLG